VSRNLKGYIIQGFGVLVEGKKEGDQREIWLMGQVHPATQISHSSLVPQKGRGGKENKGVPNGGEIYKSPKCPKSRYLFTLVVAMVLSCHKVAMSKTTFALIKKKKSAFGVQF